MINLFLAREATQNKATTMKDSICRISLLVTVALSSGCGALVLTVSQPRAVLAADLDSPLDQRPTLRSEIKRGSEAAILCQHLDDSYDKYSKCIDDLVFRASANKTGGNAFELGVYLSAWVIAEVRITSDSVYKPNSVAEIKKDGWFYYNFTRKIARELDVTDAQICEAAKINCSIYNDMRHEWSAYPHP